jgi:hypothetical protein
MDRSLNTRIAALAAPLIALLVAIDAIVAYAYAVVCA